MIVPIDRSQRAELFRNGIPAFRGEEAESKLIEGRQRSKKEREDDAAKNDQDQDGRAFGELVEEDVADPELVQDPCPLCDILRHQISPLPSRINHGLTSWCAHSILEFSTVLR